MIFGSLCKGLSVDPRLGYRTNVLGRSSAVTAGLVPEQGTRCRSTPPDALSQRIDTKVLWTLDCFALNLATSSAAGECCAYRRALDVIMVAHPLVSVVDDDASVRESLPDLLEVRGFDVEVFDSAEKFLTSNAIDHTDCIILDVSMPGMTGPELQQELAKQSRSIPIIFITARADEALFARLLERGAVDCLVKPFSDRKLRQALQIAFSV